MAVGSGSGARRANRWLRATLIGDATLMALGTPPLSTGSRVYRARLPQAGRAPALVYAQYGGTVLRVTGPDRIWSDLLYVVKLVWTEDTPTATVESIMDRVDLLLDAKMGTVTGGVIHSCVQVTELPEYDEVDQGGTIYIHTPIEYRIRVSTA